MREWREYCCDHVVVLVFVSVHGLEDKYNLVLFFLGRLHELQELAGCACTGVGNRAAHGHFRRVDFG